MKLTELFNMLVDRKMDSVSEFIAIQKPYNTTKIISGLQARKFRFLRDNDIASAAWKLDYKEENNHLLVRFIDTNEVDPVVKGNISIQLGEHNGS